MKNLNKAALQYAIKHSAAPDKETPDWIINDFKAGAQWQKKNSKHGGKRKGSGRPKLPADQKKEPTKVMRIPVSLVDEVTRLIKERPF